MKNKSIIKNINQEPWVSIFDEEEIKNWSKNDEITFNQKNRQLEKYKMFVKVFDFLNANSIDGDYFEFGCHRCRTFRMVLSLSKLHFNNMNFFAFDSFEGLPELQNEVSVSHWKKNALKTSENEFLKLIQNSGFPTKSVRTIKGFYNDSLSEKLKNNLLKENIKCKLVNIDCDLYESAVPVFKFMDDFLVEGSIIYLDDYFVGNKGNINFGIPKAFHEYRKYSKWSFIEHMQVSWWGKTFITIPKN